MRAEHDDAPLARQSVVVGICDLSDQKVGTASGHVPRFGQQMRFAWRQVRFRRRIPPLLVPQAELDTCLITIACGFVQICYRFPTWLARVARERLGTGSTGMGRMRGIGVGRTWAFAGALLISMAVGSTQAAADYQSEVLADDPYEYFRLDETSGSATDLTLMDDAAGSNDGSHVNVPTSSMNFGGALVGQTPNRAILYSSGTDDASAAGIPTGESALSDFSLEFWLNTTQSGAGSAGSQWWQGTGLVDAEVAGVVSDFGTALTNNVVTFGLGNPDVALTGTEPVNDGVWHHVVATRSGATMKLYVDGQLDVQRTDAPTGPRNGVNGFISIGQLNDGRNHFNGFMDEVAIYEKALTAVQVCDHYKAVYSSDCVGTPPPRRVPTIVSIGANTALGDGRIFSTDRLISCPGSCVRSYPEGSVTHFVAAADQGSRFGGWEPPPNHGLFDCQPTSFTRCTVHSDKPYPGSERVAGAFYKTSQSIAEDASAGIGKDANKLQKGLQDGSATVKLIRCGCEIGDMAGALAVNVKKSQVNLISDDGSSLISDKGNGLFTPSETSIGGTARLLSDDGSGLLSDDGSGLIGPDGASLIGPDGATFISANGLGRRAPRSAPARRGEKSKIYALGSYAVDLTSAGDVTVKFVPTNIGKKILNTFDAQNDALAKRGLKPEKMLARYVELIRPGDGRGTGGIYETVKIR